MAQQFQHVIFYLDSFIFSINKLPMLVKISYLSAIGMFIMAFYMTIISPIAFNYFIIPNIEKKLGNNLDHHPLIDCIFLGKWMCWQQEIAIYIANRHFAFLLRSDRGIPKFMNNFGLKKGGYTIAMMTKSEIVMSLVLITANILVIIFGIVAFVTSYYLPPAFRQ